MHLAVAPVYYHNYLLGEMLRLAAPGLAAARDGRGEPGAGAGRAGRLLTEAVYRPGASLRWDALVEAATGGR